jgi:hypothetical protein
MSVSDIMANTQDSDSLTIPLQANSPDQTNAAPSQPQQPQAQPQPDNPTAMTEGTQPSLAQTTSTLSGSSQQQVAAASNAVDNSPQPKSMFGRILSGALKAMTGAGEGVVMGGIPKAIEGAVSPGTVGREWNQQKQIAADKVQFENGQAQQSAAKAVHDGLINEALSDSMKQAATDRSMDFVDKLQQHGVAAPAIVEDSWQGIHAYADQLAQQNGGKIPNLFAVHIPSPNGQPGFVALINVSSQANSKMPPSYLSDYADKSGQDSKLLSEKWINGSADTRQQMSTQALGFLHPSLDSSNPVGQLLSLQAMKRQFQLSHGKDADTSFYDDNIKFLSGQFSDLKAAIADQNQQKNKQAQDQANAKETGKRQADTANPLPQKPGTDVQFFEGTAATGNQVAGTSDELKAAGVEHFVKMPALIQTQTLAARELTSPDGLFATARNQILSLQAKGELGPVASRWNNFWAGKGLNGDQQAFRGTLGLIATKLMQAHMGNRGGKDALEHFAGLVPEASTPSALMTTLGNEYAYVNSLAKRPTTKGGK